MELQKGTQNKIYQKESPLRREEQLIRKPLSKLCYYKQIIKISGPGSVYSQQLN